MNTTSYEEILRQHQWETHVPLNRADGESVSVRYCRECDAEMLLTHDETGFELAVIYRPPGAELWFVRSSGQDPMRPVNRGEYEEGDPGQDGAHREEEKNRFTGPWGRRTTNRPPNSGPSRRRRPRPTGRCWSFTNGTRTAGVTGASPSGPR